MLDARHNTDEPAERRTYVGLLRLCLLHQRQRGFRVRWRPERSRLRELEHLQYRPARVSSSPRSWSRQCPHTDFRFQQRIIEPPGQLTAYTHPWHLANICHGCRCSVFRRQQWHHLWQRLVFGPMGWNTGARSEPERAGGHPCQLASETSGCREQHDAHAGQRYHSFWISCGRFQQRHWRECIF